MHVVNRSEAPGTVMEGRGASSALTIKISCFADSGSHHSSDDPPVSYSEM